MKVVWTVLSENSTFLYPKIYLDTFLWPTVTQIELLDIFFILHMKYVKAASFDIVFVYSVTGSNVIWRLYLQNSQGNLSWLVLEIPWFLRKKFTIDTYEVCQWSYLGRLALVQFHKRASETFQTVLQAFFQSYSLWTCSRLFVGCI